MTFIPADEAEREIVRRELDISLAVEAGAGTGKTTLLVDRLTNLLTRYDLNELAAITFSEKAAGELVDRMRERLESATNEDSPLFRSPHRRIRALGDLDRAHISTIHSFASGLIREHAWEIDIDPDFKHLDDFDQSSLLTGILAEEFSTADFIADENVYRIISAGGTLIRLAKLAECLVNDIDVIEKVEFSTTCPDLVSATSRLREDFRRSVEYAGENCIDHEDGGFKQVLAIESIRELLPDGKPILEQFSALNPRSGNQKNWRKESLPLFKEWITGIKADAGKVLSQFDAYIVERIISRLSVTIQKLQEIKRRRGLMTFQDQLLNASKLFDDANIRADVSGRFRSLLIDEFQDTDPIQAKIALAMIGAIDQSRITSICVVGDAKQSIYRFRRADEGLFRTVTERIKAIGRGVTISQNFRSDPGIITFVNSFFSLFWNHATSVNPYIQLTPLPFSKVVQESSPVKILEPTVDYGAEKTAADEIRKDEAQAVSRLIFQSVRDGWMLNGSSKDGIDRPVTYDDIVLLMPVRTGIDIYTNELAALGIPFHVEGGKGLFAGQFSRDLVNLISAIDNPADKLSVVSVLRTPFFGVNDSDIAEWAHKSGNSFDVFNLSEGISDQLVVGVKQLVEWNRAKDILCPEQLIRSIGYRCAIEETILSDPARERDLTVWNYIVNLAYDAGVQGNNWRYFRRKLIRLSEDDKEIGDASPGSKKRGVRLMTIHSAKGLEFPFVALVNFHKPHFNKSIVIVDREKSSVEAVIKTNRNRDLMTGNYEEAVAEEEKEGLSERLRLLYVAMTRAKNYLIISRFYNRKNNPYADWIDRFIDSQQTAEQPLFNIIRPDLISMPIIAQSTNTATVKFDDSIAKTLAEKRLLGINKLNSQKIGIINPGVYDYPDEEFAEEAANYKSGSGKKIGRAVHAYCARCGKDDTIDRQLLERVCSVEAIPTELVEAKVEKLLKHPVWKRALNADNLRRELPVSAIIGNDLVRGVIDMIWEEQGTYCIADIKTGSVRSEYHARQLDFYAMVIEKVTGIKVSEKTLIYAEN